MISIFFLFLRIAGIVELELLTSLKTILFQLTEIEWCFFYNNSNNNNNNNNDNMSASRKKERKSWKSIRIKEGKLLGNGE